MSLLCILDMEFTFEHSTKIRAFDIVGGRRNFDFDGHRWRLEVGIGERAGFVISARDLDLPQFSQ